MKDGLLFFLKRAPFLRFIIAFITGILFEWYLNLSLKFFIALLVVGFSSVIIFSFTPLFTKFKYRFISGICLNLVFISLGGILTQQENILNNKDWIGKLENADAYVVTIIEPLSEKPKSWKALAHIEYALKDEKRILATGKIFLYLQKTLEPPLHYGDRILFKSNLQQIKNFPGIGDFNYVRYCLFKGITHQAYIKQENLSIFDFKGSQFWKFIYATREKFLQRLRKNIQGKKEAGLAEALLIGFRDDLDKSLVLSYTNTGVVHIIAISGLHLGLIYLLLSGITKPLRRKKIKWFTSLIIISGLWLFSLMAGAEPSILRSAIMFSCIVLGGTLDRKTSIYNSLAFSAFIILCINPFWLWDVGFQLSYSAVLSIVIFMRPVYNLFYIKNKILDFIWKMNAVTLSAQVLTLPLCIWHFHQFPDYFLLSNFIAIPLSSLILFIEILVCVIGFIAPLAAGIGKLLFVLIRVMNNYIENVESLPFSVSRNLEINFWQLLLMYLMILFLSIWLMEKRASLVKYILIVFLGFMLISA